MLPRLPADWSRVTGDSGVRLRGFPVTILGTQTIAKKDNDNVVCRASQTCLLILCFLPKSCVLFCGQKEALTLKSCPLEAGLQLHAAEVLGYALQVSVMDGTEEVRVILEEEAKKKVEWLKCVKNVAALLKSLTLKVYAVA